MADNYRRMGLPAEAESALESLPSDDNEANSLRLEIALDRNDNERARDLLSRAAPDDPAVARVRGRQALAGRDGAAAVRLFRIAYTADPTHRDTVFGLLSAYELQGDRKDAEPLRERARNLDRLNTLILRAAKPAASKDGALMRELGTTCAALGLDNEARAWLDLAIAHNPLDSSAQQALFRLGMRSPAGNEANSNPKPAHPVQNAESR
jgi:tetratricopeptide (TPR) repeat protein